MHLQIKKIYSTTRIIEMTYQEMFDSLLIVAKHVHTLVHTVKWELTGEND